MSEIKVKPWWQSVSLWIGVATALVLVVEQLVAQGVLSGESKIALVAMAIGLVLKRGFVESTVIKANAISGVVKEPPANP